MVLVIGAEQLNGLGDRHWERFAGQNYFDSSGIFISVLLSGPLVFTMFVTLVRLSILPLTVRAAKSCSTSSIDILQCVLYSGVDLCQTIDPHFLNYKRISN